MTDQTTSEPRALASYPRSHRPALLAESGAHAEQSARPLAEARRQSLGAGLRRGKGRRQEESMTSTTQRASTSVVLGFGALLFATQLFAAEGDLVAEGAKLWKVVDGALVEAGKLVFSDTFEDGLSDKWKLDGAHVWRAQDGALVTTRYGGYASLKIPAGDDFVLLARVKPIAAEPAKAGGFAGVHAAGIMFLQQPGRWWWQYRKEGEKRSRGQWKEEEIPFERWHEYKIVCRAGGIAEWFVDGRRICGLLEPGL